MVLVALVLVVSCTLARERPSDDRVRRPRGQPVDRGTDRLDRQEIRQDRPPLGTIEIQAGRQAITAADHCPTTSARPSKSSTAPANLRTRMAQLRSSTRV